MKYAVVWAFGNSGRPVLGQNKTEDDLSQKMPHDNRQT